MLYSQNKKGFTIVELLVVISILALLMGVLIPALGFARERVKVTVVDAELRQIGLALELYLESQKKFPPTHADCISGSLKDHLYQLPDALVEGNYLPAATKTNPMSTNMQDRFNTGHTYKYRSTGEIIVDRNKIDRSLFAKLWIPDGFPEKSSIEPNLACWRPNKQERNKHKDNKALVAKELPVSWVVFSLGPRFSEEKLYEKLGFENRYPVPKELWYTPKGRTGFIVRMRLHNGSQTGSFDL